MPLPLGHTITGLTIHDLYSRGGSSLRLWKVFVFVIVLANLPDIDVLIGLVVHGNGNVFHRGPTHSFLFALIMAVVAANSWRLWSEIPKVNFLLCFFLILSHVLTDAFLTTSPVSFRWPLELNFTVGHSGWKDVIRSVFLAAYQDLAIAVVCGTVVLLKRLIRQKLLRLSFSRPAKGR